MANHSKPKNEVKNITIQILVSEKDIEKHGGRENLTKSFRAVRDLKF